MTQTQYSAPLHVAHDHPSLPGHFPGEPIVPGVLLLEHVALALRAWRGQRLTRVPEAKFLAPLLPGEVAEIALTDANGRVRFEIRRDSDVLARGLIEGAA
jgi:3-hydroxymyristoyl/3-hydroxydecanoyl-(acyl carrier protein) dehydratase